MLRGISCDIKPQEVVCIIGPSGSGKSTFLRCMNATETVSEGEVVVNGFAAHDRTTDLNKMRESVGMVFQRFNLFPHMTVLENLIMAPMNLRNMPRQQAIDTAEALLAKVGLSDKRDAWPSSLSGGQQQRVAIARALAMKPSIMLFDEPTSALDPELVGDVLEVMKTSPARDDHGDRDPRNGLCPRSGRPGDLHRPGRDSGRGQAGADL